MFHNILTIEQKEEQKPLRRYTVVILNMMYDSDQEDYLVAHQFYQQSAEQQIDAIAKHIQGIGTELTKSAPNDTWIVAWRENGIRHKGSRLVPKEMKDYFKKTMSTLVMQFPQLIIIGGTISVEYSYDRWSAELEEKLAAINQSYVLMHSLIGDVEQKTHDSKNFQVLKHWRPLSLLAANQKKGRFVPLSVVSNSLYAFQKINDEVMVQRRDKFFPFNETIDGMQKGRIYLYKPATLAKERHAYLRFHRYGTQEQFDCTPSICRDLYFLDLLMQHTQYSNALFHFFVSATSPAIFKKIIGSYFFHCDSTIYPQTYLGQIPKAMTAHCVTAYDSNVFTQEPIRGPLPLVYPFELKMQHLLGDAQTAGSVEAVKTVVKIQEDFQAFLQTQLYEERAEPIFKKLDGLFTRLDNYKNDPKINNLFGFFAHEKNRTPIMRDTAPNQPVQSSLPLKLREW